MAVKHIQDDDEFEAEVGKARAKLIVMDFFATWCGPCRTIAPHFEQLARQYPQAVFLKVDVEKCDKAGQTYRIKAMPTFVFVRNGKELERIQGANASALDAAVKNHVSAPGESSLLINWGSSSNAQKEDASHMHWYMGTVDSAVQETIRHQSVMLVFVSNAEPSSRALLKSMDASPISKLSENRDKLIAVRLEENTTAATQFAAIYPVTIVPAIYFINHAGKLLQVAGSEAIDAKVLLQKLTDAVPDFAATTTSQPESLTSNSSGSNASKDAFSGTVPPPKNDEDSSSTTTASASQLTLEEKVARARQLAKQKREQREAEQKQAEMEKEQDRRRTALLAQNSQRDRADEEVKKLADERRREKREQQEERQKILKRIEDDRLERQRGPDAATAAGSSSAADNIPAKKQIVTDTTRPAYQPPTHSRILFRLPDSTTISERFEPTSTMQAVAAFVEEQVQTNEFSMLTSMPMRRLDGEEMRQKSLYELDLYPTATIIVTLPRPAVPLHQSHHDSAHVRRYGLSALVILQAMFYMLCRLLVSGFDFLAGVFYREHWFAHRTQHFDGTRPEISADGELEQPSMTRDERRPAQEADRGEIDEQLRQRRNSKKKKTEPNVRTTPATGSSTNIRRLADLNKKKTGSGAGDSDGSSSSDDEATYNGNSTQQL